MRQQVLAFAGVTIPLVLTPGITTTLVLRTSLIQGASSGLLAAAGAGLASICYGLVAATGVQLLLAASPRAMAMLQIAGALYVGWLGGRATWRAWSATPGGTLPLVRTGFREGFLANALNPPVALFYFLIVPRFIPAGSPVFAAALLLTAVHVTLAFAWHASCAAAAGALSRALARPFARRTIDAITGTVLIVFAARMLF
ncbi:MAG TPA: LysE family transporter [Vicinamibacterales bacterium]|nr:LysE family transporter [Vicinamibacterales bacterium]